MDTAERNSSFELLRIICMIFVIMLHYNNVLMGGALNYVAGINKFFAHFIESLSICAVNCFLILSGYFLGFSKYRKIRKPIELLTKVIVYGTIMYLAAVLMGISEFDIFKLGLQILPQNYYITLYSALYVFSLYINIIVNKLSYNDLHKMIIIAVLLLSIWPTVVDIVENLAGIHLTGASTVALSGDGEGYTLVQFVLMYLLGVYIKVKENKCGQNSKKIKWRYLLLYLSCSFIICLMSLRLGMAWNYCNIFVVLEAVCLFLFFKRITINCHIINKLANHVLGVYILHTQTIFVVVIWGAMDIPFYSQQNLAVFAINIFVSVFVMCLVSLVIDAILLQLMKGIGVLLGKIPFINHILELES